MKIELEFKHVYEHKVGAYRYYRFMVDNRHVAMMPKPVGGPAFMARHAELMAQLESGALLPAVEAQAKSRAKKGSVAFVVEQYLQHPDYLDLADSTRSNYARYAGYLAEMFGDDPFNKFTTNNLRKLRDDIAKRKPTNKYRPGDAYVPAGSSTADAICRSWSGCCGNSRASV